MFYSSKFPHLIDRRTVAERTAIVKFALSCFLCLIAGRASVLAQNPPNQKPKESDDVIRVYSELVQTDVMVFDKQGKFVNGLRPEDFFLRVDGKPRKIEFFEQIKAGSDEEAQLAAARGSTINLSGVDPRHPIPLDRGRIVFFFVDDFHLDVHGLNATRKLVMNFIDNEMGQNDRVAIISASGQAGFLQQLTDDRLVLRSALDRIATRNYSTIDTTPPVMTEYNALMIERNDFDAVGYFTDETLKLNPGLPRDLATNMVRNRANALLALSASYTINTLSALEGLIRSIKNVPGRKLLFFASNGFLVENRHYDFVSRLRQITSAAASSGCVIYSLDARGLVATLTNMAYAQSPDTTGRLERASSGELTASQDGLNALARDTGGKPIFNTNEFRPGLRDALKETSVYYLLAWRPEGEAEKPGRFRNIEVAVANHPELLVRVRRGFFDLETQTAATKTQENTTKAITTKLRDTIVAPYPQSGFPLSLDVAYYEVPEKGSVVSTSVQFPGEFMKFADQSGKTQAAIDLAGVFYNDQGQPNSSFTERIVTTALVPGDTKDFRRDITFTYPAKLKPGLYQVRIAAIDEISQRIGSAHAWIRVPDLSGGDLVLSSLLLGERTQAMMTNVSTSTTEITPINLSASHRFHRDSHFRFLLFIYNAKLSPLDQNPDVAVQVQIVRDDQPIITTALRKVDTEGQKDLSRLPYAAEIPLNDLLPGRYILQVTIIDRISKQSASQQTRFDVY